MKLYSYIVKHDTGFSPNPFWGYCTLSCCKPAIRRTANPGDWIVGLSSKSLGHKIVYFMEVQEVLSFSEYYNDNRFKNKKPSNNQRELIFKCGDNIYKPLTRGNYRQLESMHSDGLKQNKSNMKRDLSGKQVLISDNYVYFGRKMIELPPRFNGLKAGRGHKNRFPEDLVKDFVKYASRFKSGLRASPSFWSSNDKSWQQRIKC